MTQREWQNTAPLSITKGTVVCRTLLYFNERNVQNEQFRFNDQQKIYDHKYKEDDNNMVENKNETKITMLTIKEAAALVDGLTEYRVRELCKSGKLPCFMAGKKYLINKEILHKFLSGELLGK